MAIKTMKLKDVPAGHGFSQDVMGILFCGIRLNGIDGHLNAVDIGTWKATSRNENSEVEDLGPMGLIPSHLLPKKPA